MSEFKKLGVEELKEKFDLLNKQLRDVNNKIIFLQKELNTEQIKAYQLLGAMQNVGDLLVSLVGVEEAQKIINEIQSQDKN